MVKQLTCHSTEKETALAGILWHRFIIVYGNKKAEIARSNPESLIADLTVSGAGLVWESTTLAYSSGGFLGGKAKATLAAIG
jgi:hypothetical protein